MKFIPVVAALVASSASATTTDHVNSRLSRRYDNNGSFIPSTAPFDNIFAGITSGEEEAIYAYLERQQNSTLYVSAFHD